MTLGWQRKRKGKVENLEHFSELCFLIYMVKIMPPPPAAMNDT